MKYPKDFCSIDEQISLMAARGIVFNDISLTEVKQYLSSINYYKISGYMKNFQTSIDEYDKVEFKRVIDLYNFDRNLSRLLFDAIEKIEVAFKTNLAYYIGQHIKKKSIPHLDYVNIKNWINTNQPKYNKKHKILEDSLRFKSKVTTYTARQPRGSVENYFTKYHSEHFVPLWMLVEVIDFGMACEMYRDCTLSIRKNIAKNMQVINANDLEDYLKSIKLIRNIIAHHGIVWNFRLIDIINKSIVNQYNDVKNNSIFAIIIVITELMKGIDSNYDYNDLKKLLNSFFKSNIGFIEKFGIKNNNINLIDIILKPGI